EGEIPAEVDATLAAWRASPSLSVVPETVGGSDRFVDRLLPGILVMFLMFAVSLNAQTLVEDRRIGILERLLATPLTLGQLFAGKFLSGIVRAMAQAILLLSLAFIVLRVAGAGGFFQALVIALVVAAAVSAFGLIIAAVSRTRDQATWFAVIVTMFMTIFGGTFFPVDGPLDIVSRITLNRYAIDAMEGVISRGETLGAFWVELAVLGGVAAVCLAVARPLFRVAGATK
ncbi:MAG: ABC transporter permease, partial [SAR202 cluster bacterium]|nr:ABC transporter permease [SAR202 cluster bacterium]